MRSLIFTILFVFALQLGFAQDGLPPNPEDGKCYAKCVTQEEWKDQTEKVLVKPAYKVLKVVPAEYKTVTETIVIKEKTKRFCPTPSSRSGASASSPRFSYIYTRGAVATRAHFG